MTNGEKFNKVITEIVEGHKPKSSDFAYKWSVETKCGKLDITVHEAEKRQKLFSVFCCFNEPDKAKLHTNCNPYSGKWNFHSINMKRCIESFEYNLNKIVVDKASFLCYIYNNDRMNF